MKKSEIYLLFSTMMIGVAILLVALFHFIKPTSVKLDDIDETVKKNKDILNIQRDGWMDKVTKKSSDFSYPTVIYKLNL